MYNFLRYKKNVLDILYRFSHVRSAEAHDTSPKECQKFLKILKQIKWTHIKIKYYKVTDI